MKKLKAIANVGILSPLVLIAFLAASLCYIFFSRDGMTDEQMWAASFAIAIPAGFLMFGVAVLFSVGIVLHAVIAAKTKQKATWAWWTILVFSILLALNYQWGIRIAGIGIIVLLLTLKPFRILRTGVEQPISSD